MLCCTPSFNNSEQVAASVASAGALPCVVADNASAPDHAGRLRAVAAASGGRVSLVEHPANLGRVANWDFCVRHFLGTPHAWLKWLFAGDVLSPDAGPRLAAAAAAHPDAKVIVARFDVVDGTTREPWRPLTGTRVLAPAESLRLAATWGNWFGPPLAQAFHRDALAGGARFSAELPWVADGLFALDAAERHPVLYLDEPIGEFRVAARNFYRQRLTGVRSFFEDGLFRAEAADRYLRVTGDAAGHADLLAAVRRWANGVGLAGTTVGGLGGEIVRRVRRRATGGRA